MNNEIIISKPQTPKEFEAYYLLRYEILRKPWGQPRGSEKDENEESSIHIIASDNKKKILGVCRLQFNSEEEAQIRFMAVDSNTQGMGVGQKMLQFAEQEAKKYGRKKVVLQARENAVEFYKRSGYQVIKKTFLMWNEIQHYLMEKTFIV